MFDCSRAVIKSRDGGKERQIGFLWAGNLAAAHSRGRKGINLCTPIHTRRRTCHRSRERRSGTGTVMRGRQRRQRRRRDKSRANVCERHGDNFDFEQYYNIIYSHCYDSQARKFRICRHYAALNTFRGKFCCISIVALESVRRYHYFITFPGLVLCFQTNFGYHIYLNYQYFRHYQKYSVPSHLTRLFIYLFRK